jgi:hypothetical protein
MGLGLVDYSDSEMSDETEKTNTKSIEQIKKRTAPPPPPDFENDHTDLHAGSPKPKNLKVLSGSTPSTVRGLAFVPSHLKSGKKNKVTEDQGALGRNKQKQ